MAGEPLTIFDPRRNFQLQGFTGRGATTTIHDASATGVSVSGIFQAAEDFAVLGLLQRLRLLQPPAPEAPAADGPLRPDAGVRYRVRPRARRRDAAGRRQVPVRLLGLDDLRVRQGRRWRDPRGEAPLVRHGGVRRRDARQRERRGVGHAGRAGRGPPRRRVPRHGVRLHPVGQALPVAEVAHLAQRHHRPVPLRSRPGDRRVGVEGRGHGVLHVRPALSGRPAVPVGGDLPRHRRRSGVHDR